MIFNIDFFFCSFAVVNVWSYLYPYAKLYANVSQAQFGVLAMIFPMLSFFAKPISCTFADAHGAHREVQIAAFIVFGSCFGILGALPFFKSPDDHESDSIAWIIISIFMCLGYTASACVFSMNDAMASNYARKHNLSYSRMRMFSNLGWASGGILNLIIGDVSFLPRRVFGHIVLLVSVSIDVLFLWVWPYPEDFEMFHDGSTAEQRKLSIVGPNTLALLALNKPRGSISWDMLDKIKAGRSKSVGHLPQDRATITSQSTSISQQAVKEPEEQKEYTNFQVQMMFIKLIAAGHKSFFRNLCLFTLYGMVQGAMWTYQLDYVDARIAKDKSEFEFLSSFCMIAQAILGEMLTNVFASDLVRIFGSTACLSLSLISLGIRCYFYCNILPYISSYFIVIGEALQGPSLGLYGILIVEVGSYYALMVNEFMPEMKRRGIVRDKQQEEELSGCLRATMIGLMSSSAEGLGVAVGSLVAGVIADRYGYDTMWNICAVLTMTFGFVNISWDVLTKLVFSRAKNKQGNQIEQKQNNLGIPSIVIGDAKSKL